MHMFIMRIMPIIMLVLRAVDISCLLLSCDAQIIVLPIFLVNNILTIYTNCKKITYLPQHHCDNLHG